MHTWKFQVWISAELCDSLFQIVNAPSERKMRDGTEYTEYRCEDAHEIVYREILKQSYYMFRLFNGMFQDNLIGDDETQQVDCLIAKLTKFYSKVGSLYSTGTVIMHTY